jgi:hypothetical protein
MLSMSNLTAATVIRPSLLGCITAACGLEQLNTGRHVRRDERGWIMRDENNRIVDALTVQALWLAEIRPAFMDIACLAMLTTEHHRLGLFAIETHPWAAEYPPHMMPIVPPTMVCTGPIALDAEWADPVSAALRQLEGWSSDPPACVTLDGIGYTLFAENWDAQLAIEFSNPGRPWLVVLEDALLRAARMLAAKDSKGVIAPYVDGWTPYAAARSA